MAHGAEYRVSAEHVSVLCINIIIKMVLTIIISLLFAFPQCLLGAGPLEFIPHHRSGL